jgi:hypothetical protein
LLRRGSAQKRIASQGIGAEEDCFAGDRRRRGFLHRIVAEEDCFAGDRCRRGFLNGIAAEEDCFPGIGAEWRIKGIDKAGFLGYQCRRGIGFPDHHR